jgi:uncharacterized membrane protein YbhN (UPF0104 family)
MGLFDSSVASMLLSNSFQQSRITSYMGPLSLPFHLPLSFLVLSFLHPILFAIASVEVAKRRFPFTLYSAIQIIFSLSIVIAATSNLFEMWKLVEVRGASYLDTRELLKNIAAVVASPVLCYISIYWWQKPVILWRDE